MLQLRQVMLMKLPKVYPDFWWRLVRRMLQSSQRYVVPSAWHHPDSFSFRILVFTIPIYTRINFLLLPTDLG